MAQFNFHKVKPGEVILQLAPWWEVREKSAPNGTKEALHDHLCMMDASDHKILINASPFEYGNILLVPFISSNYPQLITPNALRMAVEMMLLSRSRLVIRQEENVCPSKNRDQTIETGIKLFMPLMFV